MKVRTQGGAREGETLAQRSFFFYRTDFPSGGRECEIPLSNKKYSRRLLSVRRTENQRSERIER